MLLVFNVCLVLSSPSADNYYLGKGCGVSPFGKELFTT